MREKRRLIGVAAAACMTLIPQARIAAQFGAGGTVYPTDQEYAASKEAQQHATKAKTIAGSDLKAQYDNICTAAGPQRPAVERQTAGQGPVPPVQIEPTKLFDNFYYFGFNTVGAWALATSDGIILIDTLNTVQEAENVFAAGLTKMGLNLADVKYIVIGHGHADHFGGAPYFQDKYHARVAMGAPDWDLIAQPPANPNSSQANRPKPKRDIALTDGQKITLGDATITVFATPGHTPGTLALLIPVKDKGTPRTILMLSGANTTPDTPSLAAFEKALKAAKQAHAVAVINSHLDLFGDEIAWMAAIRKSPAAPSPFVYSEARFDRFLDIMDECATAREIALAKK